MKMLKGLSNYISEVKQEYSSIPADRKVFLSELATYMSSKLNSDETIKLMFICTHNSRRSHIAQIWASTLSHEYGLKHIKTYSGGTEATAFNPRAVKALRDAGLDIEAERKVKNPAYAVKFSEGEANLKCFSKEYDHPSNPKESFAAVMTCSDADENCPFIPGAEFRISIPYEDPKVSDGTPTESKVYAERVRQIAIEIGYVMEKVDKNIKKGA